MSAYRCVFWAMVCVSGVGGGVWVCVCGLGNGVCVVSDHSFLRKKKR